MKVVLSGGGTAGHINPALAVAEVLAGRGCEVLYAGKPDGVEARLAEQAGLPFKGFAAMGFDRSRPLTLPKAVLTLQKSSSAARAWFADVCPDAVACFGGYACIPVGRAAAQAGVPLVVHEQNSVMGMANAYLAKRAAAVCLTYAHAASALPAEVREQRMQVTGNPVRTAVFQAQRDPSRQELGIPADATVLLVTGGSLGARHLNQAVVAMKDELLSRERLHVVHLAGPAEHEAVRESLSLNDDEARRWRVLGYTDRMGQCMAAADCIVSRAGASSLAEISARALPALLVPFPYATADHQTMNARSCVEAGSALMVADADVEGADFRDRLLRLVDDADMRERMAAAARRQKTVDAARLVADAVERAAASAASAR